MSVDARALLRQGLAFNAQDQRQEAVIALKHALRLDPALARAWTGIGIAYGRMNKHAQAADALRQAIALGDDSGEAWLNLSRALQLGGHAHEAHQAIAAARQACARLPDHPHARYALALASHAAGDDMVLREVAATDSPLGAEARALLEEAPPAEGPLRGDLVDPMRQAIAEFAALHQVYGGRWIIGPIMMEMGALLGTDADPHSHEPRHALASLPGRTFSGAQLLAWLYAGTRHLDIAGDCGVDLRREYAAASSPVAARPADPAPARPGPG